ncbi:MAG: WhiB family transcriptional regulator [Nitriliruptoraceae bacterium]|nr:WhiB family transcriptional regulator [Nitriliruptoraceae bacterium]
MSATLTDLVPTDGWQQDAACREADPELFFANGDAEREAAMALCGACPVRTECLEHALSTRESYGIWGGTDEHDRKRLIRRRRRNAA